MTAITRELRQKQKQYYDTGRKTTVFDVGDFVVVRRPPRSGQTGISAKLVFQPNGFPDGLVRFALLKKCPMLTLIAWSMSGKLLDPTNIDKLVKV